MSSQVFTYSETLPALLHGVTSVPLTLSWRCADPVAVRCELPCFEHVLHRWHVARQRITRGLVADTGAVGHDDEGVAAVRISRMPGTDRALLILRGRPGRWPLVVPASELDGFVARTYQYCPAAREQSLLDAELQAELHLFSLTQGQEP